MTDLVQTLVSDGGLLLFSAAGLAATAVAIVRDTRSQYSATLAEPRRAD